MNVKGHFETRVGNQTLKGEDAWNYVNSLGAEGWELVSVATIIGSTTVGWDQALFTGTKCEATTSTGSALWFKRPIEHATQLVVGSHAAPWIGVPC